MKIPLSLNSTQKIVNEARAERRAIKLKTSDNVNERLELLISTIRARATASPFNTDRLIDRILELIAEGDAL